jgi:hypothetical protein
MTWKPDLSDVPQPIPTQNLLRKAVWKLYTKRVISNPYEVLKDEHGIYGYRYGNFVLVSKKEIYGNIVSVHEEAILKARMHRVGIVMWLESAKKFYWFDPEVCDREGERNMKGKSIMVNFNIKLGRDTKW